MGSSADPNNTIDALTFTRIIFVDRKVSIVYSKSALKGRSRAEYGAFGAVARLNGEHFNLISLFFST